MTLAIEREVAGPAAGALSAEHLAARVRAGVVQITDGRGSGAGTIWRSDETGSLVVTNYHVAPGQRARVTTSDGTALRGEVVANLPERDLAVIKVDARGRRRCRSATRARCGSASWSSRSGTRWG